jgi:hypothetical protein
MYAYRHVVDEWPKDSVQAKAAGDEVCSLFCPAEIDPTRILLPE